MTDDDFDYGPLGRDWWLDAGETCKATATQIKFACARHSGCTRVKAAALAGYSASDDQGLRVAGSRSDDTKAVQDMLVMASAAAVTTADAPYTVAEARQKIGRMVKTSHDPGTVIKGTELLAKLDQIDRDRGQTPEDDGFGEWRATRDFLLMENGATQFMLWYRATMKRMGWPGNYPMLHDVHSLMQREPFGQQIWDWCCDGLGEDSQKDLEKKIANKNWQLEARIRLWKEVGVTLDAAGNFKKEAA